MVGGSAVDETLAKKKKKKKKKAKKGGISFQCWDNLKDNVNNLDLNYLVGPQCQLGEWNKLSQG